MREGIAIRFEALKRQIPLFTGDRTEAVQLSLLGVYQGIDPIGIEWSGNGLCRVVVSVTVHSPSIPNGNLVNL